jgi:hypothetical protein
MGLLDRLKGRSVQIAVALEPAFAAPGQDVVAQITIEGEIDDKAEGAHVALRCVNRYSTTITTTAWRRSGAA